MLHALPDNWPLQCMSIAVACMCPGIETAYTVYDDGGLPILQDYRRRLNRAERRKAEKAGDGSGAALREAAEEAEFERAKVPSPLCRCPVSLDCVLARKPVNTACSSYC